MNPSFKNKRIAHSEITQEATGHAADAGRAALPRQRRNFLRPLHLAVLGYVDRYPCHGHVGSYLHGRIKPCAISSRAACCRDSSTRLLQNSHHEHGYSTQVFRNTRSVFAAVLYQSTATHQSCHGHMGVQCSPIVVAPTNTLSTTEHLGSYSRCL